VTGGARGIGASISRHLIEHGAAVTVVGRHTAPFAADVSDPGAVDSVFLQIRNAIGPADILVNNAGQAESAPFLKTGLDVWRRMMAVNVDGTFHCTRTVLKDMLDRGWGRVISIASTAALTGYPYVSAYCAAKHAVLGLTRSLALEVASKGITVNAVCPGFTDTDLTSAAIENIVSNTGRTREEALAQLVAENPLKRLVVPDEVANAVLWLCLPGSEAINGQAIAVAGGAVM
jgi:NAD(P)-dependent dehydrogenase (short-subunit alcohol dehydrogenase family)